jgi:hypothetical protein
MIPGDSANQNAEQATAKYPAWIQIFLDVHKLFFFFPRKGGVIDGYERELAGKLHMSITRVSIESLLYCIIPFICWFKYVSPSDKHFGVWSYLAFVAIFQYMKILQAYLVTLFTGRYKPRVPQSSP